MKKLWRFILTNQKLIYKALLLAFCSFLIVYLFPKGATFKYEFQKGKPWQYATLFAPFDFSILKSTTELEVEKQTILDSQFPYYRADESVYMQVKASYDSQFSNFFNLPVSRTEYKDLYEFGFLLLDEIYNNGVLPLGFEEKGAKSVYLIKGNVEYTIGKTAVVKSDEIHQKVEEIVLKTVLHQTNFMR